ncbi:MAG: hypothetical protein AB1439_01880 [candidate division FCPU426 bacterium]
MNNLREFASPESLYLMFVDGSQLYLTREHIDKAAARFWEDPAALSDSVKAAAEFKRCEGCTLEAGEGICDALRPVLPLLEHIDKFTSVDPVQVVYTGHDPDILHFSHTDAQTALAYVSLLSLIHYCRAGRKFRKYFYDITPLISASDLARRLYLNIYWLYQGNAGEIKAVITHFSESIRQLSQNQVRRLSLISKNDVFNNALVKTHTATALLMLGIEKQTAQAFARYEETGFSASPPRKDNPPSPDMLAS